MKFKTYLFDFDGTLVDSMPTFASTMLRILDESNISYGSDIVKIITPLGYKGTAENFTKLGIDAPIAETIPKMMAYYLYEYEKTIIEFKHGSLKITKQYSYNTNLVIQALKELGKENVTNNILRKIGDNFTLEELSKICTEAKNTTIWIYQYILKIKEIKDAKNS